MADCTCKFDLKKKTTEKQKKSLNQRKTTRRNTVKNYKREVIKCFKMYLKTVK